MSWFGCCTTATSGGGSSGGGGSGSGYLVSDLIEEARTLVDDDHTEERGWIKTERWIRWLNWEMQALSRRAVQSGLIRPPITETTFTGPSTTLSGVLQMVGVVDEDGTPLADAQEIDGGEPFWDPRASGQSQFWAAHGAGDTLTLELHPEDTREYTARYIEQASYATADTDYILVPQGFERRLVYGMAAHAHIKESARSAALREMMFLADAEIGFTLFGRTENGGPRVRTVRRHPRNLTPYHLGQRRYRG